MFELNQLEQLLAFAEYGTLSAAAEHLAGPEPFHAPSRNGPFRTAL